MTPNNGSEYQIRIVHGDGTEELSDWMATQDEISQAIEALSSTVGSSLWLRERNALCPDSFHPQHVVAECPILGIPTQRYRAHDSYYLIAVGSKSRGEIFGIRFGHPF